MSPSRLAAAALPVVAIVVLVATTAAAAWSSWSAGTLGYDYAAFDLALRRTLSGERLYDLSYEVAGGFGMFAYPPPFVLFSLPFAVLPRDVAVWAVTVLLVVAFAAAVAILPLSRTTRWLVLLLGALSWPLVFAVKLGQVGPILLLTFAAGWRWLDRPWRWGLVTAVGTAVKVQPALLFGWALLAGRRRALVAGLAVLAVLALAATVVAGPTAWADQATILGRISRPVDTPHSYTPGRLALEAGLGVSVAWTVQVANWLALALAVLYATLRRSAVASYLVVVIASQLASPVLWDHYALMLLLPVARLLERGRWWAAVVPLASAVPLVGLIPGLAYPVAFWGTLLAVVWDDARAGGAPGPSAGSAPDPEVASATTVGRGAMLGG